MQRPQQSKWTPPDAAREENAARAGGVMSARLRVVHLTTVHSPLDPRIRLKEARSLREAGWQVDLIAAWHGADPLDDGIARHPLPPRRSRVARMILAPFTAFRIARRIPADLFIFHDPELLLVGLLLKWSGRRVAYDSHEDAPATVVNKAYIPKWVKPILQACIALAERLVVPTLDGVIVATPPIGRRFTKTARRLVTVRNYPLLEDMPTPLPIQERVEVDLVYVGILTRGRGAVEMVRGLEYLTEWGGRLHIAGRIVPEALYEELRSLPGWSRVVYHGVLRHDEVVSLVRRCGIGLVTVLPEPNHIEGYPTKMFEYMACGLPVVASDFPLWREFQGSRPYALLVSPEPKAIAEAVTMLLGDIEQARRLGAMGRLRVEEEFNWDREGKALVDFCRVLVEPPTAGAR